MNSDHPVDQHVGELLSGYVDGELTQQQRQKVQVHCGRCAVCRDELSAVQEVRSAVSQSILSPLGEDVWRERSTDAGARALSYVGWFIVIASAVAFVAGAIWLFVLDTSMHKWVKLSIGGVYLGAGCLLLAVLRQRLLERKSDKYKDVEI